jgi:streptogramin lyase
MRLPAFHHPRLINQYGFSLILVSVALTVAALIFVSFLPGRKAGDLNDKIATNTHKLDKVEEAMRNFMAANGRRPCPADGQYGLGTANFGIEAGTPGTCQGNSGSIPNAPLGPDAGTGNIVGGVIPTRALSLSDDFAFDEFGRFFTYVVDKRATAGGSGANACSALMGYPANDGKGGIKIESSNGVIPELDDVMYAYISHGPDGFGAFPMQGSTVAKRINSGSTDADQQVNAGVNSSFTYNTANWTNVKVKKSWTPTFDDMVWYRPDLKNTCCLGAKCVVSGGGGAQNTWVVDPGNNRIQKFNSSGSWLQTVPGSGCAGASPPACTAGSGNGQFSGPKKVAIDSSGNLWVIDNGNHRVEEFNSSGSFLLAFGGAGTGNGQFSTAGNGTQGIASDGSGNVWVADTGNSRVQEFNSSGSFLQIVGGPCGHSCGNGQFASDWDLAITGGGNVWVVDLGNSRVQEFNSSGSFITTFGSKGTGIGQFAASSPNGIAIDGSGNLWVTDLNNNRVEEFNSSGSYLSQFSVAVGSPGYISVDTGGNVWVTESFSNQVQEFNSSGSVIRTLGTGAAGVGNGQFSGAGGIAVH